MGNDKSIIDNVLRHGSLAFKSLGSSAIKNNVSNTVAVPFSFQPFWLYEKKKPRIAQSD